METRRVDVAVIGAGTAGLGARREAHERGATTVMIESGPYGTTCARVGCMPSKLLIAAADVAHEIRHSALFGVEAGEPRVDGPAVLERVRRERDRFVGFVVEATEEIPDAQRVRGRARFVGPMALEVGDTRIEAGSVVIATGSRPSIPPALQPFAEDLLTNDDVFELEDLPESVAVIGTGVIGLELGQALARLGVRTSLFARSDRMGTLTDPDVLANAREVFGGELDLHFRASPEVERSGTGFRLCWTGTDGEEESRDYERVLVATGRTPNLDDLGLEQTGVELDSRGVPRFDPRTMQCGDARLFLAGDVAAYRPVLHEAADEGRIAGHNAALWPEVRAHVRRIPLTILFTDPQIALVGERFAELDEEEIEIGEVSYADQGRARVMGKNAGLVRIYARRTCGTLLGAEMFGPRVEHTSHLLAWAVASHMTVAEALARPFYHPVVEEGIRTALRDLAARLRLEPPECATDLECGPGV